MAWTPGFPATCTECPHENASDDFAADGAAGGAAGAGEPEEGAAAQPPAEESNCIQCHSNGDVWDKDQQRYFITAKNFAGDIHWQKGLRCPDCHGGDPTSPDVAAAHSKDAGFKAVKSPADVPAFCGNCHANIEYMRHYRAVAANRSVGRILDQRPRQGVESHGRPQGGHLHLLPRQAARIGRRPEQARNSGGQRPGFAGLSYPRGQDLREMPRGREGDGRLPIPRPPLGPRTICRVAGERPWPGADGQGRPERADLQQLPRQPRRRAARSRLGGQRLRHLPREDRRPVRRYQHEAPLRGGETSRLRHLPRQPQDSAALGQNGRDERRRGLHQVPRARQVRRYHGRRRCRTRNPPRTGSTQPADRHGRDDARQGGTPGHGGQPAEVRAPQRRQLP